MGYMKKEKKERKKIPLLIVRYKRTIKKILCT